MGRHPVVHGCHCLAAAYVHLALNSAVKGIDPWLDLLYCTMFFKC
jgi:hypothetical protein